MAERRFPLLQSDRPRGRDSIPWSLAERVYEDYAYLYGRGQSLERLAERGGFGWGEITLILVDAAERRERSPLSSLAGIEPSMDVERHALTIFTHRQGAYAHCDCGWDSASCDSSFQAQTAWANHVGEPRGGGDASCRECTRQGMTQVKRQCEHEGCRNEFFVDSADSDLVYCGRRDCAARVRPGGR